MLFGEFSIADAFYAPVCLRLRTYGLPVPGAVTAYVDRVCALPGVAAWIAGALAEQDFVAFAESKPLRKEFMPAMGRTGFPQKDMDAALARLRRTYERMDAEIADSGGPWLGGADLSLADISVMPAIVRMADLGQGGAWQDLPRVQRWYDAIRAHPAFAPTYYPGSLLTERFPHLREALKLRQAS